MPPKANPATRGGTQRGAKNDAAAVRISTRSKAKPASTTRHDPPNAKPPVNGASNGNLGRSSRKITRSSSNISTYDQIFVGGPPSQTGIAATYKRPIFIISGLEPEFLSELEQQLDHDELISMSSRRSHPLPFMEQDDSDDEPSSPESPVPNPPPPRRGGRGGRRGGRGGRGRGGRIKNITSARNTRPIRTAAPTFPLTDVDEEVASEIDSSDAALYRSEDDGADVQNQHDEMDVEPEIAIHVEPATTSPRGSPFANLKRQTSDLSNVEPMQRLEPSPLKESAAPTPRDSGTATPANSQARSVVEIVEEDLSESDLPPGFRDEWEEHELDYDDIADEIMKKRFQPMTDIKFIVDTLEGKCAAHLDGILPAQRSTEVLLAIARNAAEIALAYQNEWLMLDVRTAPQSHPPKKPSTGGRIPIDPLVHEDIKEADLYNYIYDPKKAPGTQDPFLQRLGRDYVGGRELRQRRAARDMLGSAAASEEDEEEEEGGRAGKRRRRAVQRFDGTETGNGGETPPRKFGWGGARKRGVSAITGSQTPEVDRRAKRTKTEGQLLPQRIREMRGESIMNSSGDSGDDGSPGPPGSSQSNKRRGRPPGSKNLQKRSDAGIKKGPRKGTFGSSQKSKPMTLESLSQGQSQFAIEPMIRAPSPVPSHPVMPPSSTVFQAAPQPATAPPPDLNHGLTPIIATAEQYITTTPLSQYGSNHIEEPTTPNGSNSDKKRKQRVKSEKRSQSMTIWWAERKARAAERKMAEMKASGQNMHHDPRTGGMHSPSMSSYSSPMGYSHTPTLGVSSGLTALPTGGGRNSMPLLAPAPSPSMVHSRAPAPQMYRSAYPPTQQQQDPRGMIPRPSSGGPPPLAPAPPAPHRHSLSHIPPPISPYGPPQGQSQPQVYQPHPHHHQQQQHQHQQHQHQHPHAHQQHHHQQQQQQHAHHRMPSLGSANPYGHPQAQPLAPAPERRESDREMDERSQPRMYARDEGTEFLERHTRETLEGSRQRMEERRHRNAQLLAPAPGHDRERDDQRQPTKYPPGHEEAQMMEEYQLESGLRRHPDARVL